MTFYRRNRERKEISRPISGTRKEFLLIAIIVFLQSFSFALAVDNSICEGKPMGYAFEDPDNCASYFECIFGEAEANNCSPGYKFDAVSEACVVGSCDSVTTATTEDLTTENPTTEDPTTESQTTESQTTLAVDSNICEGKPMGWTFEDQDDCTRYFECIFGEIEANNCPTGKKWDAVTESCIVGNCESVTTTTTTTTTTTEDPTTANPTTEDAITESSTTNPTTEDAITESSTTANPTTLAVDKSICKGQVMGWRFEDPNDCTGFFECIGDEAEANNCFPGFKYDAASQLCVVGECETATTTTTEDPTTESPTTQSKTTESPTAETPTTQSPTTQSPTTQSSTTQSPTTQSTTTETPTTQSPTTQSPTTQSTTTQSTTTETPTTPSPTTQSPTTQSTTTKKPTTSSTEPGIECPAGPICQPSEHGTVHRDARDCRKFYVCRNGEAITHLCDKGKFFDENTNLCNFDVLVACTPCTIDASTTSSSSSTSTSTSTSTTTSTTQICQSAPNCKSEKTGFMYRDPKDCSKFYICINGIAYGRSCRKGEYFDLNVFACLFSSVVECIPNKNCLPTSSKIPQVTSTPRPISTSTSRALVLNGQVDPNFTDCMNLPNGSVKRHPVHCSVFYVCRNGMAIKQTCMYKQFFDENRLACNFRVLVDCPSGLY